MKVGKNGRLNLGFSYVFILNFSDHFPCKKNLCYSLVGRFQKKIIT